MNTNTHLTVDGYEENEHGRKIPFHLRQTAYLSNGFKAVILSKNINKNTTHVYAEVQEMGKNTIGLYIPINYIMGNIRKEKIYLKQ